MVNRFLNIASIFYFNLSSPSGIATCTALHANRRFHRLYCSRCSNSDKYTLLLYFLDFSSVLTDILRGRELIISCNRLMQKLMLHYLKGLLAPFCSSSKRYQIPFCSLQKGIRYRMQNPKNPRKSKGIACGSRIPSCSLQKGRWFPLELLQKVIKYPLEQIASGICELHATPMFADVRNIPLEELKI